MKKKIIITILIIIGLILLDSFQALVCNNNPIIKIKEYYNGGDLNYISKSLLVDTYNCVNGKKDTVIKGFSYSCSDEMDILLNDIEGNVSLKNRIEVVKNEIHNLNKFNKYLERDNRIVYFASNINEVYYYQDETKYVLKDYISKMYHTTDDVLKDLTYLLEVTDSYDDGGTTVYKSSKYDITVIKCNTIDKNNDIYIGNYEMNFDNDLMCK